LKKNELISKLKCLKKHHHQNESLSSTPSTFRKTTTDEFQVADSSDDEINKQKKNQTVKNPSPQETLWLKIISMGEFLNV
jgi:hypothetical protein